MNSFINRALGILLIQIFVFSFLSEWILHLYDGTKINFIGEFLIFLFLFLPLLFLYFFRKTDYEFQLVNIKTIPISLVFLVLPLSHLFVLLKNNIFSRRVGTEVVSVIFSELSSFDRFVIRIYDLSMFTFVIIGFIILSSKIRKNIIFFRIVFYLNIGYIIIFSLFNGRSLLLVITLIVFIFDGILKKISRKIRLFLFGFSFIAFLAVSLIRYIPLILFLNVDSKEIVVNEFLLRSNCSKFFNEVYEATQNKGLLLGRSVQNPFLSIKAQFGDKKSKELIAVAETGSKQYILANYLGSAQRDECSCTVVDSYANFGFMGIVLLSFTYFIIFFSIYKITCFKKINAFHVTLIVSLVYSVLFYENDGLTLLLNLTKFIPVFFLFGILNPICLSKKSFG